MRYAIQKLLDQHETDHERLEMCWGAFIKYEGWKILDNIKGKPFSSLADFCKARRPQGLGRNPDEIDALLKEGAAKKTAAERAATPAVLLDGPGPATKEEKAANDKKLINGRGPTADYLTARIARDRPDILERMKAGAYPSVRQAAIAAGIVRPPTPLDMLKRAWAKASKKEPAWVQRRSLSGPSARKGLGHAWAERRTPIRSPCLWRGHFQPTRF